VCATWRGSAHHTYARRVCLRIRPCCPFVTRQRRVGLPLPAATGVLGAMSCSCACRRRIGALVDRTFVGPNNRLAAAGAGVRPKSKIKKTLIMAVRSRKPVVSTPAGCPAFSPSVRLVALPSSAILLWYTCTFN